MGNSSQFACVLVLRDTETRNSLNFISDQQLAIKNNSPALMSPNPVGPAVITENVGAPASYLGTASTSLHILFAFGALLVPISGFQMSFVLL